MILAVLLSTSTIAQEVRRLAAPEASAIKPTPAVQPASIPDKPAPQRVMDKKFMFVLGTLGAAESMRITSTTLILEKSKEAGAPWITRTPSHPSVIGKNSLIFASELLVAYEMKKPHPWLPGDKVIRKLWWTYPVAMSVVHFKGAGQNMATSGPGGCRSLECASRR